MSRKIFNVLISMKTMAVLILLFATSIGVATFIENDFGTPASKAVVYNTTWFETLLILLLINLVGNIYRYKMMQWKKWPVFMFHIAFILMIIGAGITRYVSYEGIMHIREGQKSSVLQTSKAYLQIKVDDKVQQYSYDKALIVNPLYNKPFSHDFNFNDKEIRIEILETYNSAEYYVEEDANAGAVIELISTDGNGRITKYLEDGSSIFLGQLSMGFNDNGASSFTVSGSENGLVFQTSFPVSYMSMDDRSTGVLNADTIHEFKKRHLYTIGGAKLVMKEYYPNATINIRSGNTETGSNVLKLGIRVNDLEKEIYVKGGKGYVSSPESFSFNGLNFHLGYGSKYLQLPFSIALVDFEMERYPGSMSPASYASDVILTDESENIQEPHRIYMNHVLDYKGFRFFQSSYDKDELGTILSVNHDNLGTIITYLGYLLMTIGMLFSLFIKGTRYDKLKGILKKVSTAAMVVLGLSVSSMSYGQHEGHDHEDVSEYAISIDSEHAETFGSLLVQDRGGRVKPINTMASEILRKLTRKESLMGLDPTQLYLSMMVYPEYWQNIPMIKVSHDGLKRELNMEGKFISFQNMFDDKFQYVLGETVEEVNRKKQVDRSKFDKDLIAVDERVNIAYMVYTGSMLKVFPDAGDENNKWYSHAAQPFPFKGEDSLFVRNIIDMYVGDVISATKSGDWTKANESLSYIVKYQNTYGEEVIPSESKIKWEVIYNRSQIFKRLFQAYGLVSFILLIMLFVNVFKDKQQKGWLIKGFQGLLVVGFIFHTIGLVVRWYISGHAPWSNAYESMIFIAWTTVLAGLMFSRKSSIAVAVTGILASLILMVAHLNWMDPEITNLVPVLDSYWLMIHVAVITSSYGFLGLSALLGFLNLLMMIFKRSSNENRIKSTLRELTTINEMTVEIGLFLLTIGTFLGGVWANESWGRYWGWDAKETWALVTVLVYAFIAHMRFIPKLNSQYSYNVATMVGYLSVMMTYFGVNYYLSGLHSYAAGDAVPIPSFVYYTLGVMFLVIVVARFKTKDLKARVVNKNITK